MRSAATVVLVSVFVYAGVIMSSPHAPSVQSTPSAPATPAQASTQAPAASTAAPSGVVHIPASQVDAMFAKGGALLETEHYQVHAARRAEPGPAEVHATDTDIFYVLEGSATVVTGGTVVGATMASLGETRGTRIEGGRAQPLAKGDVLVIPAGTPHQLQAVDGTLRYFVVKVTN